MVDARATVKGPDRYRPSVKYEMTSRQIDEAPDRATAGGRSSAPPVTLLRGSILNGVDPDTAWERIERARGLAVPDTAEQREWTVGLLAHV
ncbi:hypothetical protein ABTX81_35180 [Kitasatospora sp. NPDC097605]|uniref:hypothetical protein n=1 Tax=Kitasatospora sp. NPDC097605 TaxID=3157226 RepID=UPI0033218A04